MTVISGPLFTMKLALSILGIAIICTTAPIMILGQVNPMSISGVDSLKIHQVTGSLFLGFDFTKDATEYLYLSFSGSGLYVDRRNTYGVSSVVYLRGLQERSTSNSGYVIAQADLWRHNFEGKICKTNRIHAEPFAMLQFDENRGINARWQLGAYAVPAIFSKSNVHISAGVGMLWQFDRYDLLPPDYVDYWDKEEMERIYKAIHELDPDTTWFMKRNGPRVALFLSLISSLGKLVDWNIYVSLQQPFTSVFKGTPLYDVSADYQKPYPCITIESTIKFKILKWLSINLRYYMQHDRNQLTYYLPFYTYSITTGVNFGL